MARGHAPDAELGRAVARVPHALDGPVVHRAHKAVQLQHAADHQVALELRRQGAARRDARRRAPGRRERSDAARVRAKGVAPQHDRNVGGARYVGVGAALVARTGLGVARSRRPARRLRSVPRPVHQVERFDRVVRVRLHHKPGAVTQADDVVFAHACRVHRLAKALVSCRADVGRARLGRAAGAAVRGWRRRWQWRRQRSDGRELGGDQRRPVRLLVVVAHVRPPVRWRRHAVARVRRRVVPHQRAAASARHTQHQGAGVDRRLRVQRDDDGAVLQHRGQRQRRQHRRVQRQRRRHDRRVQAGQARAQSVQARHRLEADQEQRAGAHRHRVEEVQHRPGVVKHRVADVDEKRIPGRRGLRTVALVQRAGETERVQRRVDDGRRAPIQRRLWWRQRHRVRFQHRWF